MKTSIAAKAMSFGVAVVFLTTNTAFSIPQTLGEMRQTAPTVSRQNSTEPETLVIPEAFGSVKEAFVSSDPSKKDKWVLEIQDSHANYEAQTNIQDILDFLSRPTSGRKLDCVAVEGAQGNLDTGLMRRASDEQARQAVTDRFVKAGYFTGAETYAINSKHPVKPLFGVEDKALYFEDLDAFRKACAACDAAKPAMAEMKRQLDDLKIQLFSGDALDFIGRQEAFALDKITLTEYLQYLQVMISKTAQNLDPYPQLKKMCRTIDLEEKTDPAKVEAEKKVLLEELQKKLVKEELSTLIQKSLLYRIGKIPAWDFYRHLETLAKDKGLPWENYPNLNAYVRTVELYADFNMEHLLMEIDRIEEDIKKKLYNDPAQHELDRRMKNHRILQSMLELKLNRKSLAYYQQHRSEVIARGTKQVRGQSNLATIDASRAERFYDIALQRDLALVTNTLRSFDNPSVKTVAMVTGGFHSEGMKELIKQKGYSYAIITPCISKIPDEGLYRRIMLDEQHAFDRLLDSQGNRLAAIVQAMGNALLGEKQQREVAENFIVGFAQELIWNSFKNPRAVEAMFRKNFGEEVRLEVRSQTASEVKAIVRCKDTSYEITVAMKDGKPMMSAKRSEIESVKTPVITSEKKALTFKQRMAEIVRIIKREKPNLNPLDTANTLAKTYPAMFKEAKAYYGNDVQTLMGIANFVGILTKPITNRLSYTNPEVLTELLGALKADGNERWIIAIDAPPGSGKTILWNGIYEKEVVLGELFEEMAFVEGEKELMDSFKTIMKDREIPARIRYGKEKDPEILDQWAFKMAEKYKEGLGEGIRGNRALDLKTTIRLMFDHPNDVRDFQSAFVENTKDRIVVYIANGAHDDVDNWVTRNKLTSCRIAKITVLPNENRTRSLSVSYETQHASRVTSASLGVENLAQAAFKVPGQAKKDQTGETAGTIDRSAVEKIEGEVQGKIGDVTITADGKVSVVVDGKNVPIEVGITPDTDFANGVVKDGRLVRIVVAQALYDKIHSSKDPPHAFKILARHEYVENVLGKSHAFTSAVDARIEGTPVHALMEATLQVMTDEQLAAIQYDHPNDPEHAFYKAAQAELARRKPSPPTLVDAKEKAAAGDIPRAIQIYRGLLEQLAESGGVEADMLDPITQLLDFVLEGRVGPGGVQPNPTAIADILAQNFTAQKLLASKDGIPQNLPASLQRLQNELEPVAGLNLAQQQAMEESRILERTVNALLQRDSHTPLDGNAELQWISRGGGSEVYKVTVRREGKRPVVFALKFGKKEDWFRSKERAAAAILEAAEKNPKVLDYISRPLILDAPHLLATEEWVEGSSLTFNIGEFLQNPGQGSLLVNHVARVYFGFWVATGRRYFIRDVKPHNLITEQATDKTKNIDWDFMIETDPMSNDPLRDLLMSLFTDQKVVEGAASSSEIQPLEEWLRSSLSYTENEKLVFLRGLAQGIAAATGRDEIEINRMLIEILIPPKVSVTLEELVELNLGMEPEKINSNLRKYPELIALAVRQKMMRIRRGTEAGDEALLAKLQSVLKRLETQSAFKKPGVEKTDKTGETAETIDRSAVEKIAGEVQGKIGDVTITPDGKVSVMVDEKNVPIEVGATPDTDFANGVVENGRLVRIVVAQALYDKIHSSKDPPQAFKILARHEFVENLLGKSHAFTSAVDARIEGKPVHALMEATLQVMTDEQLADIKYSHDNDPEHVFYYAAQSELLRRGVKAEPVILSDLAVALMKDLQGKPEVLKQLQRNIPVDAGKPVDTSDSRVAMAMLYELLPQIADRVHIDQANRQIRLRDDGAGLEPILNSVFGTLQDKIRLVQMAKAQEGAARGIDVSLDSDAKRLANTQEAIADLLKDLPGVNQEEMQKALNDTEFLAFFANGYAVLEEKQLLRWDIGLLKNKSPAERKIYIALLNKWAQAGLMISMEDYAEKPEEGIAHVVEELLAKHANVVSVAAKDFRVPDAQKGAEALRAARQKLAGRMPGAVVPNNYVGHFLAENLRAYFSMDDLRKFEALLIQDAQTGRIVALNQINKEILRSIGIEDVAETINFLPEIQKDRQFINSLEQAAKTSEVQA